MTATGCSWAGARRPTLETGSIGPSGSRVSPKLSAFPVRPSSTAKRSSSRAARTNFSQLQAALARGRQGRIEYNAFDLLYLDRYDLRAVAQVERKRLLTELFDRYGLGPPLRYSEHLTGNGEEICTPRSSIGRASSPRTPPRPTAPPATKAGSRSRRRSAPLPSSAS